MAMLPIPPLFPFISSSLNLKYLLLGVLTVIIKHTKDVVQRDLTAPLVLLAKDECYMIYPPYVF